MQSDSSRRSHRPTTPSRISLLPAYSSPISPHIRTPSPSTSSSPPRRSMRLNKQLQFVASRLPRPVLRGLVLLTIITALIFLTSSVRHSLDEGVWNASSHSDRRGVEGGGLGGFRRKLSYWAIPSHSSDIPLVPASVPRPKGARPYRAQPNATLVRQAHQGFSRTPIIGQSEYNLGPLPSLEQAFARLEPKLREIKDGVPSIPREHALWSPILAPHITEHHQERYHHLRSDWDEQIQDWVPSTKRYLFVTVCRDIAGMLADWFAAWTVLANYLGPESMLFSLLEGDSQDGSGEIISTIMRDHLLFIGVPPANIHIRTRLPAIDWEAGHRIEILANLRNDGMKPFYDSLPSGLTPDGHPWSAIIFYNDVYLSATHFLELMHQHFMQDADMTCGWDQAGKYFYDGWIGRDMSGDLFSPFPIKDEDSQSPPKFFINDPSTKERFDRLLPFQVFAAWNGVAVLNPGPFLPPYNVKFRRGATAPPDSGLSSADMECQQSECSFIPWDFWKYGFGRIQVVPGVHATYSKGDAMLRGWIEFPLEEGGHTEAITWQDRPPSMIRCHDWPDYPGKGWWAWDTVRWVPAPPLVVLDAETTLS